MPEKVYFVLPVFNEAINLPRLVSTLSSICQKLQVSYQIVLVDDGSKDSSVEVAESLVSTFPIVLLKHSINRGPGAAFQTGFEYVLSEGTDHDFLITMDADNTHSTQTVGLILSDLRQGYEMVIASVFASGGMMIGVPFLRYVLTLGCNFLYRIFFPVRGIREYTGFYRGYRVSMLRLAKQKLRGKLMTVSGFASMAELLIRLRRVPVFMKEVPMIVRYDHKGGKSKLRIGKTIREHLWIIGSNFFQRRVL